MAENLSHCIHHSDEGSRAGFYQSKSYFPRGGAFNSPAFSLVHKARWGEMLGGKLSQVQQLHRALFELFYDGRASPTDTLPNGMTLLHTITRSLFYRPICVGTQPAHWHALLSDLLGAGVFLGATDHYGQTPLDLLLTNYGVDETGEVSDISVSFCARLSSLGCPFTLYIPTIKFPQLSGLGGIMWLKGDITIARKCLQLVKEAAARNGVYDTEIPRELIPLISQSEDDIYSLLKGFGTVSSDWLDFYAGWPAGLAVLLRNGYSPTVNTLYHAVEAHCVPSIQLLLGYDSVQLDFGLLSMAATGRDSHVRKVIVKALAERRRRLNDLAKKHLSDESLASLGLEYGSLLDQKASLACALLRTQSVDITGLEQREAYSVYRAVPPSIEIWTELWDSGFTDMDGIDYRVLKPTWPFSKENCVFEKLTGVLKRADWLISKGANPEGLLYGYPALHTLALSMGLRTIKPANCSTASESSIKLFHRMICDNVCDDCVCACSVGGCSPLKVLLEQVKWSRYRQAGDFSVFLDNIDNTLTSGGRTPFYDSAAPRILRYLTFCELDLTHTCCFNTTLLSKKTVDEIREDEDDLINQLDELVENFVCQYKDGSLPFHEFLRNTWRPKMTTILCETPNEEDILELRKVGVHVHETTYNKCNVPWRYLLR
ncbi:hypothetical protein BJX64DRAFT_224847 [Aspergillus heterothallicus]